MNFLIIFVYLLPWLIICVGITWAIMDKKSDDLESEDYDKDELDKY